MIGQMIEYMELEEGEVVCSKCKGRGSITSPSNHELASLCTKCGGAGKVDWITNAMGEKKPKPLYGTSSYNYANAVSSTSYNYCGSTSGYGLPVLKSPPVAVVGSMYVDGNTQSISVYNGSEWEEVDDS